VWATHTLTDELFGEPNHFESTHIDDLEVLSDTDHVYVEPIDVNHYAVEFPNDVVELVDERSDIAFLFGFGILKGDILELPEHGILCHHHGDMSKYRGRPAGFWEFLNGEDCVGITLRRISEELDQGEIVATTRYTSTETTPDRTSR